MSGTIRISLRAGERVYVNGAVIQVDRKTRLEFLNNVVFLLESHVMQPEMATTPMRRLYFSVQKMLIDPSQGFSARQEFYRHYLELLPEHEGKDTADELASIHALVNMGRNFEALKRIRRLYEAEDAASCADAAAEAGQRTQEPQRKRRPRRPAGDKIKGAA